MFIDLFLAHFYFSTSSRQILEGHPASYPMGIGGFFTGDKAAEA
jgi:hypothetical protein